MGLWTAVTCAVSQGQRKKRSGARILAEPPRGISSGSRKPSPRPDELAATGVQCDPIEGLRILAHDHKVHGFAQDARPGASGTGGCFRLELEHDAEVRWKD